MEDIWEAINNARVIIADCTGRNPNVFYEIGLAVSPGRLILNAALPGTRHCLSSSPPVRLHAAWVKRLPGGAIRSLNKNGECPAGISAGIPSKRLGKLGTDQLAWLKDDLGGRSPSTPVVVFAHIPLWTVYPQWGWGTDDGAEALTYLKRFGSVTVLNGHIHQTMQKVEGNVTFHTAMSTAFPQPAPGSAPAPGPMKVPAERLRSVLGITNVSFQAGKHSLAGDRFRAHAGMQHYVTAVRPSSHLPLLEEAAGQRFCGREILPLKQWPVSLAPGCGDRKRSPRYWCRQRLCPVNQPRTRRRRD